MEKAQPILDKWIKRIREDNLLSPSLSYGYFECGRVGNTLRVFENKQDNVYYDFQFPRQRSGNRLCISDYFNDLDNGVPSDYVPMQAVTMGHNASEFANSLFLKDSYTDYLYFHGLAVQLAEALAEWIHAKIRKECGFSIQEPKEIRSILAQKYRGSRYSFGYPACPNVSDSKYQLKLLRTEDIPITMDESDQLHPEQSTTAIVALHSKAKYFSA